MVPKTSDSQSLELYDWLVPEGLLLLLLLFIVELVDINGGDIIMAWKFKNTALSTNPRFSVSIRHTSKL